jgi:hypothetical protein
MDICIDYHKYKSRTMLTCNGHKGLKKDNHSHQMSLVFLLVYLKRKHRKPGITVSITDTPKKIPWSIHFYSVSILSFLFNFAHTVPLLRLWQAVSNTGQQIRLIYNMLCLSILFIQMGLAHLFSFLCCVFLFSLSSFCVLHPMLLISLDCLFGIIKMSVLQKIVSYFLVNLL